MINLIFSRILAIKNETERKEFKLPVIVPIVLYNGEYNWTVSRTFKEILSGYDIFEDCVLDFKYILIDVNRYNEHELIGLSNLIGSVFLLDQKIDISEITVRLKKMMSVLKNLSPEEFLLFKNWFKNVIAKGLDEEFEEVSKIIEESEEAEIMIYNFEKTLKEGLERKRMEGRVEGKIEGKIIAARNMLIRGLDVDMVAEVTELTLDEVEKLKKQINDIIN